MTIYHFLDGDISAKSATILYLNYRDDVTMHRRKLDGVRRFAKSQGVARGTRPASGIASFRNLRSTSRCGIIDAANDMGT